MRTSPSEQSYSSVELKDISTLPSQIEIGEVVKALNELLSLAWAKKDTAIIADASKLRTNLAQMQSAGRTTVESGVYALIHSQITLVEAKNANFKTEIASIFTQGIPETVVNDRYFSEPKVA